MQERDVALENVKNHAELQKLIAENQKLFAEQKHYQVWFPIFVVLTAFIAGAAVASFFASLLL